jgi:hypothetical protein
MELPEMIPLQTALRACTIAEERMIGRVLNLPHAEGNARAQRYTLGQWFEFEKELARFCVRAAIRCEEMGGE